MNILAKSNNRILEMIREHMPLFISFEHVYLFGSVLNPSILHNDIDILVVYTKYSEEISNELELICTKLEKVCGLPIDITALSTEEAIDTSFLEKIKPYYLKLK